MTKCKYCGNDFQSLKIYGFRRIPMCMKCLFLIVDQWSIQTEEYVGLQDGRNFCSVNECKYEINHSGQHSWEVK